MKSGIINVYKEAGYTSFDVVARLRGILGIKKIGHTGTLDPDATGVLPVCIGKATKVCDLLTDRDKEYRTVMLLGLTTDTLDMSGNILSKHDVKCTNKEVEEAVMSFVGEISQIPPMYSALKVDGKKLCDLARNGITVDRKPRNVMINSIVIEKIELPRVYMKISCSKGTYIRTLCDDIGAKLGCGAAMESLVRTRVSSFSIEDAILLDDIVKMKNEGTVENAILEVDRVFDSYDQVLLPDDEALNKVVVNGGKIFPEDFCHLNLPIGQDNIFYRIYLSDKRFVGIYSFKEGKYILEKMFLE